MKLKKIQAECQEYMELAKEHDDALLEQLAQNIINEIDTDGYGLRQDDGTPGLFQHIMKYVINPNMEVIREKAKQYK